MKNDTLHSTALSWRMNIYDKQNKHDDWKQRVSTNEIV